MPRITPRGLSSSHSEDAAQTSAPSGRGSSLSPGNSIFSSLRSRRSTAASSASTEIQSKDAQIAQLQEENGLLKQTIKNLEAELKLVRAQAQKYRQLDATENPERAETQEETLFNVCNHRSFNELLSMQEPRVISNAATEYLTKSVTAGDSLSTSEIKELLNTPGKMLSLSEFNELFPRNVWLTKIANDVEDGDKQIAVEHLECMATMASFCTSEDGQSAEQNSPYIGPDGITASLYAFQSAARHNKGNASLDQGARSANGAHFTLDDITPNNSAKTISEKFNETWALPLQRITRRESFNPSVNYGERQNARLAETEMTMQGFGKHKAQMCMIIDKTSFDHTDRTDVDHASRITRQVAQLANKLDDNGQLEVFSHEIGTPTILDARQSANLIRLDQSIMKQGAPTPEAHIFALLQHFYPDDPESSKYHKTPVFCTLVTKSLSEKDYTLLKNTTSLFSQMKLPFFLKVINVNPDISQEEIERMQKLDDKVSDEGNDGVIDNVDVVHAREPSEITPKNFLREYAGFVVEAQQKAFLQGNQGFDASRVNVRGEGRTVA